MRKIRQGAIEYHNGGRVKYIFSDSNKWKRSRVVVGQDDAVAFARHE